MTTNYSGPVLAVCLLALLIRCAISLHGYSGAGQPPMYGDFEAQRHWMEITYNLPILEWYHNTTNNDLMYWGLDYPPLTAYHSWLCGCAAAFFNKSWVALYESRGIETLEHKCFMRLTVLLADVLIFFTAVFVYFSKCCKSLPSKLIVVYSFLMLIYPGLMLIDHGHFQYNCISLGFSLWALVCLISDHDLIGSIMFVLALNYKQMELYHAIPFFCYLLGSCFTGGRFHFWKLIKISLVTISTFVLCWLPFLQSSDSALQVLKRLFPFARGLYEDKVANVWCTLSLMIKFKEILSREALIKLCFLTTFTALLPSSLHLLIKSTKRNLTISLVNVSLVFFLFSFQVHEKSILIPALSVCTLLPYYPFACMWFLIISVFSMVPLLIRDGLLLPTIATTVMFLVATCSFSECHNPTPSKHKPSKHVFVFWPEDIIVVSTFLLSMIGTIVLTFFHLKVKPPPDLPHIYPALIEAYSCAHFAVFLLFFHWKQFFGQQITTRSQPTKGLQYSSIHHKTKKNN